MATVCCNSSHGDPIAICRGSAVWRRSSHSGTSGNCVEVSDRSSRTVAVRDSKNPDRDCLVFTASAWRHFTRSLKPQA